MDDKKKRQNTNVKEKEEKDAEVGLVGEKLDNGTSVDEEREVQYSTDDLGEDGEETAGGREESEESENTQESTGTEEGEGASSVNSDWEAAAMARVRSKPRKESVISIDEHIWSNMGRTPSLVHQLMGEEGGQALGQDRVGAQYDEEDYTIHRKEGYPHIRHQLKPTTKKATGTSNATPGNLDHGRKRITSAPEPLDDLPRKYTEQDADQAEAPESSERAAGQLPGEGVVYDRGVQFVIGKGRDNDACEDVSDVDSGGGTHDNITTEKNSSKEFLTESERDEGPRRRVTQHTNGVLGHGTPNQEKKKKKRKKEPLQPVVARKQFDRTPHEVFVELDELAGFGELSEWRETARWIKFEEDVEEAADKWSKPHVSSLSFHSLLELRRCLEHGVVLLDLEEDSMSGIAHRLVDKLVTCDMIRPEDTGALLRTILLRHRHLHQSSNYIRPNSSFTDLLPSRRGSIVSTGSVTRRFSHQIGLRSSGRSRDHDVKIEVDDAVRET